MEIKLADAPELTITECLTPSHSAHAFSNSFTLAPLVKRSPFKRKLITYLNQTQMLENYKKNKEQLNS